MNQSRRSNDKLAKPIKSYAPLCLSFRVFGVFRGSHFLIKNSGHRSESDGLMLDSQKTALISVF